MADVLNFLYFAVGLGVGLFGLWLSQKHFLAQQQDKFNRISDELEHIRESLAVLAEVNTDRSYAREDRLMQAALRENAAEVGAEKITEIVRHEMAQLGTQGAQAVAPANEEQIREVLRQVQAQQAVGYGVAQLDLSFAERALADADANVVSRRDAYFLANLTQGETFSTVRLATERRLNHTEALTKLVRWREWGWLSWDGVDNWVMLVDPGSIPAIITALAEAPPPEKQ